MKPRGLLPLGLILVAAMLAIAIGIEQWKFGATAWLVKLPLALLLGLAVWRSVAKTPRPRR